MFFAHFFCYFLITIRQENKPVFHRWKIVFHSVENPKKQPVFTLNSKTKRAAFRPPFRGTRFA